tara:strand:- start:351 stop:491 length:141 start_codon:yes stop_codon:yes gene_type:complete
MASDASDFEVFLDGIFGEGWRKNLNKDKTEEETEEEKALRITGESA